jgi:hypothetical protein
MGAGAQEIVSSITQGLLSLYVTQPYFRMLWLLAEERVGTTCKKIARDKDLRRVVEVFNNSRGAAIWLLPGSLR